MKTTATICLCLLLAAGGATARETRNNTTDLQFRTEPVLSDKHLPELDIRHRVAAQGTTRLAYFTFDLGPSCVTEGWLVEDHTAQTHDFWHVASGVGPDAELDGGTFGMLVPLEGDQSMWCGADGPVTAAEDLVLCGYAVLPGYGNNWDQAFCLKNCLTGAGGVEVDLAVMWDAEPGYDATTLQADNCDGNWVDVYGGLGTWDGWGSDTLTIAVSDTLHSGFLSLRFNFISDGAWSDADGLWNTDGAILLDMLTVRDTSGVVVATENFEDETPGDTDADDWQTCTPLPYGDYSALYPGLSMVQEDPCNSENDCLWAYIEGSTATYSCGGWPAQSALPYVNARNQYIYNTRSSPAIPVVGSGSVWEMVFDVYRDLQLDALVFYTWAVRTVEGGCPGNWNGDGFVRYGGGKDWLRNRFSIGEYIDTSASHIQVEIGARDMCGFWCGVYGTGSCHSHAPLIDDVEIIRVAADGPQWGGRDIDMFQDGFAQDGTNTGTARADMAQDILPSSSLGTLPGDSVVINCTYPGGLAFHTPGDTSSGAAVYFYCSIDGPSAAATGGDLLDDPRYNHIGTTAAGGRTWFQIQMDSTWTSGGGLVDDRYNIDLNDNLFVPGDTVWHFFGARSSIGEWTYYALPTPTPTSQAHDIDLVASNADEFTILPAAGVANGGDCLYVDGMNFRGSQPYFDTAFDMMNILHQVDRYDIRGPSSGVGNHPGARVQAASQLYSAYRNIIWTCGDLETVFADGSGTPDKSDDTGLLFNFLDNLPGYGPPGGGVYLNGDDVADKWLNVHTSGSSTQLRTKYMTFSLAAADHVPTVGISPLVVGEPTGIFRDGFGVDTMVVFGGCPLINDFDIITAEGTADLEMSYHGNGNTGGAVVSQLTINAVGNTVAFLLSGFSYHYIRDSRAMKIPQRAEHLHRIMTWMSGIIDYPVEIPVVALARNELRQNYPNPFNPVTTIRYQVKTAGPVTLKVYNVAGQLVRTLVDETVEAGRVYEVTWRGQNDAGHDVSSGVYFYKLVASDYVETKKMVLLK
jgi:hypothetical protein